MRSQRSALSRALANTIGTRLRTMRSTQRLPMVVLASLSGVDAATISRIERGRMPGTLESHLKLSRALGLTLAALYEGLEARLPQTAIRDVFPRESDVAVPTPAHW